MRILKSKKSIMGIAAMLILIYHIFPLQQGGGIFNTSLKFIVSNAYIGVDIFFFLSAYMIYFSDTSKCWSFLKKKFKRIYPLFIFSCLIYFLMGKISFAKVIPTLFGIDLVKSGGGSFLWFLPAVFLLYIFAPFYLKLLKKVGNERGLLISILIWCALIILLEKNYQNAPFNIFLARLPIIFIALSLAKYEGKIKKSKEVVLGMLLTVLGLFAMWKFVFISKLDFYRTGYYYILAIPLVIGLILLLDSIYDKKPGKITGFFGQLSLELYCCQMIFGSMIFGYLKKFTENGILTFTLTLAFIVVISYILYYGKTKLLRQKSKS